jgi:hypothetical protein
MFQDLKIIALVTSLGRIKRRGDGREKEAKRGRKRYHRSRGVCTVRRLAKKRQMRLTATAFMSYICMFFLFVNERGGDAFHVHSHLDLCYLQRSDSVCEELGLHIIKICDKFCCLATFVTVTPYQLSAPRVCCFLRGT